MGQPFNDHGPSATVHTGHTERRSTAGAIERLVDDVHRLLAQTAHLAAHELRHTLQQSVRAVWLSGAGLGLLLVGGLLLIVGLVHLVAAWLDLPLWVAFAIVAGVFVLGSLACRTRGRMAIANIHLALPVTVQSLKHSVAPLPDSLNRDAAGFDRAPDHTTSGTRQKVVGLLKDTVAKWSADHVPRLGASLAYYTIFSLGPLLVVVIAIAGLVFGQEAAQGYLIEQLQGLVGENSARAIQDMLERAQEPSTGMVAGAVAIVALIFGAGGVFAQLQDALNCIWGVAPKEGRGLWGLIKDRFLSLVAVLGTGFLLLVSLVLSAALAALGHVLTARLAVPEALLHGLNFLVSLALIAVLFALIFKLLPDAEVGWRDVWIGSTVTALLFTVGKFALGVYLGKSEVGSAYGSAGSLVVILLWVYYSSQLVLFGAEFTAVYADRYGSRVRPKPDAEAVSEPAVSHARAGR